MIKTIEQTIPVIEKRLDHTLLQIQLYEILET